MPSPSRHAGRLDPDPRDADALFEALLHLLPAHMRVPEGLGGYEAGLTPEDEALLEASDLNEEMAEHVADVGEGDRDGAWISVATGLRSTLRWLIEQYGGWEQVPAELRGGVWANYTARDIEAYLATLDEQLRSTG